MDDRRLSLLEDLVQSFYDDFARTNFYRSPSLKRTSACAILTRSMVLRRIRHTRLEMTQLRVFDHHHRFTYTTVKDSYHYISAP